MGDARLVLALTAGMLATVNPCALPMLPAYLGWFITGDDERQPTGRAVARAVVVALSVTLGFVVVFGALGLLTGAASARAKEITPWITPIVGLAMAGLGVALLLGKQIKLPVPRVDKTAGGRGVLAMATYGASYAVVSVSCALGPFVGVVGLSFGQPVGTVATQLGAFAAGFALVLVALSVSAALARGSLAALARRATQGVGRAAGVILVASGVYLVWYGITEIRLQRGDLADDPIVGRVTGWSSDISVLVHDIGGAEVGLVLALFTAVVALVVLVRSGRSPSAKGRAS
jgi:cytochrome c biogenesis protein CcdA